MKAGDVIGRQVTVREGGTVIGKIKDLVVDQTGREVIGMILSDSMFSGSRVVPWNAVLAFGPDSLVIDTANSVAKATALPEIQEVLAKNTRIKGLRLLTTKGKDLGRIIDLLFDESTGEVVGYELTGGRFSASFDGTPFLPTPQWIELGKDVAFVAPEVEPTITATGGVRSALRHGAKTAAPAPILAEPPVHAPAESGSAAPADSNSVPTGAPTTWRPEGDADEGPGSGSNSV